MPRRAITARMMSLAVTPGLAACPRPVTASVFDAFCSRHLRRQHVRHLAGADAERQRAERAVRAGVAVAADDGHARLRQPQLGADDVHDPLPLAAQRVQLDAELVAVLLERRDLRRRGGVEHRDAPVAAARRGRRRVIHRRDRALGTAHLEAALAQPGERLRRRDLVDQVQVDVEDRRRVRRRRRARGARPRSSRTSSLAVSRRRRGHSGAWACQPVQ